MTIAFRTGSGATSDTGFTTSTTQTHTLSSSIVAGDLVLLCVANGVNSADGTSSVPSVSGGGGIGWTDLGTIPPGGGSGFGTTINLHIFAAVAVSATPGSSVTINWSVTGELRAVSAAWSGAASATLLGEVAATSSSGVTSILEASSNVTSGVWLVGALALWTVNTATVSPTFPTDVPTERVHIGDTGYSLLAVSDSNAAEPGGNVGGGSWSWSGAADGSSVLLSIAPADISITASGGLSLASARASGSASGGDNSATGSLSLNALLSGNVTQLIPGSGSLKMGRTLKLAAQGKVLQPGFAIKVELLLNGTWTDISQWVYQRDAIVISGGQSSQSAPGAQSSATAQPATMTLTVNNRDGRFTPEYAGGAYYPYLVRNVQIRVWVDNVSQGGSEYYGYRFWGTVPDWPPNSDMSGRDVYCQITASGPLRQVNQGGGMGSALTRYYGHLTGAYIPIAYWPCEEGPNATLIGAGIDGGDTMSVISGTPLWQSVSDFNGSAPIAVINNSTWDGLTGSYGASGDDIFSTPGDYEWVCPAGITSITTVKVTGPGGGGYDSSEDQYDYGYSGPGGGGGEKSAESNVAVTPGQSYLVHVGAGGVPGNDGDYSHFAGDSVTVTAHAGTSATPDTPGAGGTGSTNTTHYSGGPGGQPSSGPDSQNYGGGGGGSSGGDTSAGNAGGDGQQGTGGSAGAAVAGGGPGGYGGHTYVGTNHNGSLPTSGPGGGGGGAAYSKADGGSGLYSGAAGFAGEVELIYTPVNVPNSNVIRFIMKVPSHGGNNGRVVIRTKTGGTIAQLDVLYQKGGALELIGYSSASAVLFDTGNQAWGIDGQLIMVSIELVNSGTSVNYVFSAIRPGEETLYGTTSGTVATASVGNVSEVIVSPNGDISRTAMGHISVQYALIPLTSVSQALDGNDSEMSVDRLERLAQEQGLGISVTYGEGQDHWGFEDGTVQGWTGSNATVGNSSAWSSEGSYSLLITASGGSGQWYAMSPVSASESPPVLPGDRVTVTADLYAPAALGAVEVGIRFLDSSLNLLSYAGAGTKSIGAGGEATSTVTATAPANAAYFNIEIRDNETSASGILLYADNIRISPLAGPQPVTGYQALLKQIETLEQGILKEERKLWGLGYRTRVSLFNQTPAVTLDYAQQHLALVVPAPVFDDLQTQNDITVTNVRGSSVRVTLTNGSMSVQQPPSGTGKYSKNYNVVAQDDEQLAALVAQMLTLGTNSTERYPVIAADLMRYEVDSIMPDIANVEIGDYVQVINLPFWYPSSTAKQLVIGYQETITPFDWQIRWNCVPEDPYEVTATAMRRW